MLLKQRDQDDKRKTRRAMLQRVGAASQCVALGLTRRNEADDKRKQQIPPLHRSQGALLVFSQHRMTRRPVRRERTHDGRGRLLWCAAACGLRRRATLSKTERRRVLARRL